MIRRFGVLFFIIISVVALIKLEEDGEKIKRTGYSEGIVRNIREKERSKEYYLEDTLIVDFKKKKKIKIGDKIKCFGKEDDLNKLKYKDFDYGRYLRSIGIKRRIQAKKIRVEYRDNGRFKIREKSFIYSKMGGLKFWIRDVNRYLYKKESDILNAMLIGDKSSLNEYDRGIFADSATSHVMAISGLHVSIIMAGLLLVIGRINSLEKLFVVLLFLTFYMILVGGGASISRAIALIGFFYIARFLDRKLDLINILGIVAGIMVLENKYILYNISFQLSFLAMTSIGIYTKYIKKILGIEIISSTIAVSILTLPIVLYNFKSASTMGVLGNLIILPFIGILIFLDILSLIIYSFSLRIALFISDINGSLLRISLILLDRVGCYGANNIEIREAEPKYFLMYYLFIILLSLGLEYFYINKNR